MKISPKIIAVFKIVTFIGVLVLAFNLILPFVTSDAFKLLVQNAGVFAPLIVISYTVISHVLAPVAGSPGIVLSMAIFGLVKTVFYLYIASLISAVINFWISRRSFGESPGGHNAFYF